MYHKGVFSQPSIKSHVCKRPEFWHSPFSYRLVMHFVLILHLKIKMQMVLAWFKQLQVDPAVFSTRNGNILYAV